MPSARNTSPGEGARSSAPPGRRTRGASPSAGSSSCQVNGRRLLRAKSSIRIVASDERGPTICRPEALDRLQRLSPGDERGQDEVAQRPVVEQQLAHHVAVDGDVAQGLGDDRGDEDGLSREQVQLAEEPGRAVADDLLAGRVDDRDLALEDRDERVPLIADAVEHVADIGRVLLTELSQGRELRVRQHRAVRRCHGMSVLTHRIAA